LISPGSSFSKGPSLTEIACWDNLLLAFQKASRGKRGNPEVAVFEYRLEENLIALREELLHRTYLPFPYSSFYIHEPKRRLISAAPFRDRVVHHALCNLIEPIFECSFVADSYANRVGKGTHRALNHAQDYARRFRYVLQVDIRQFFPSIDHAILRAVLAKKLLDPGVLWLIERILASGVGVLVEEYQMVYFPGDDLFAVNRPRGLPIGNLTSQFWANVYLSSVDHFIKRQLRCPGYVRYVDDLLLFAHEKQVLWAWKDALVDRLAALRVTIHPGAHPRPVTEGIPFLGFIVFPARRRLKRRKGVHYQRRVRAAVDTYRAGQLPADILAASLRGWVNHVRYANTVGLQKAILRGVPGEVLELLDLLGNIGLETVHAVKDESQEAMDFWISSRSRRNYGHSSHCQDNH
jgi:RNA-directed DNA polymerase